MGIRDERSVEAVLFSTGVPVGLEELKGATGLDGWHVRRALDGLMQRYNRDNRDGTSLEIVQAGGKYAMQVKQAYKQRGDVVATPEISEPHLKTLALIAFHQPIKQSELRRMIGDKTYAHVDHLESMHLIDTQRLGNTEILTTSRRFPEYFGLRDMGPDEIRVYLAGRLTGGDSE